MTYRDNVHITTQDLLFVGVLNDIKKSKVALQPIFEAFTNAMEAIKIRSVNETTFKGKVTIKVNVNETTLGVNEFSNITIIDNGIGFNEKEFKRFNTFKDFTKGFKNLGSGRIQYAHHFDHTVITSVFSENGDHFEREFIVSKKDSFLHHNAIVFHKHCKPTNITDTGTKVNFNSLLENSNIYNGLTAVSLKEALLEKYIHYFCYNKATLPEIEIEFYVQAVLKDKAKIEKSDIPKIDKKKRIKLKYSRITSDGKSIEHTNREEGFEIDAFKIKAEILKFNDLKIVSKGEIVEGSNIALQSLGLEDKIKGYKYLFLVSSNYIDSRDTNIRGELNIPNKDSFSKNTSLFTNEEILLEDIQRTVNDTINELYPEIQEVKRKHDEEIDQLKEMFLLDDEMAKDINISINDSESRILEKFYEAEAKKVASVDASIKESIDRLNKLDTTSQEYADSLKAEVEKLVKTIPLQNRTSLTHYVARRKLLLDLFEMILDRKLDIQSTKTRDFDEALIHNLLFQQSSDDAENSDLWIINEDFVYFKGSSEKQLVQVELNGEKIFNEGLTEDENEYLNSLGERRQLKRPDVLLFPDEGKCIIIEFKAPNVNAADHLNQIDFYASLILNHAKDKFQITTFYGYLIGESIEPRDVLGRVSRYEHSYHFDYLFRPSEKVNGFNGKPNGSIYTEVLKYSTLLARAKNRNKIFIDKLN